MPISVSSNSSSSSYKSCKIDPKGTRLEEFIDSKRGNKDVTNKTLNLLRSRLEYVSTTAKEYAILKHSKVNVFQGAASGVNNAIFQINEFLVKVDNSALQPKVKEQYKIVARTQILSLTASKLSLERRAKKADPNGKIEKQNKFHKHIASAYQLRAIDQNSDPKSGSVRNTAEISPGAGHPQTDTAGTSTALDTAQRVPHKSIPSPSSKADKNEDSAIPEMRKTVTWAKEMTVYTF